MTTRIAALALSITALAPAAAFASAPSHEQTPVCAGGWIERAPASHPIGPAYKGDRFSITRARPATVHHTYGTTEHFAKGRLTHRDVKSHKTFTYQGWISTRVLNGGSAC